MKYIYINFFVFVCLVLGLNNNAEGQSACHGNDVGDIISTDPNDPQSVNDWNWMEPDNYTVWGSDKVSQLVPNPFNGGGGTLFNNPNFNYMRDNYIPGGPGDDGVNFHPEDGWELLIKQFGKKADGSIQGRDIPFFVLYNRYTGKLRLFALINKEPVDVNGTNGLNINMTYEGNSTNKQSALLGNSGAISTSVEGFPDESIIKSPSAYVDIAEFWAFGQFSTAYDPCACKNESNIRFEYISLEQYDLKLEAEINGKIDEIIKKNDNVQSSNNVFKTAFKNPSETFKAGKKGYKSGEKFANNAKDFIDSNAGFLGDEMGFQIDQLKNFTKGIPYVNTAVNLFEFFSGGGKTKKRRFRPLAFEVGLNFKGDGSLIKKTKEGENEIKTPGSLPNQEGEGKS